MSDFERRMELGISKLIIDLVKSEYEAKGRFDSKPEVTVKFQESISVMINTENPFLGDEFWEFLAEVGGKVEKRVKVFGYVYKKPEFVYDYCILNYEFKTE